MNIVVLKRPDPAASDKGREKAAKDKLNELIKESLYEAFKPLEQEINQYPDHKIIFTNENQLGIVGLPPRIHYQIEYIFTTTQWLKM